MKIAIFGCSGTAGFHISAALAKNQDVVRVARNSQGADFRMNAADSESVESLLQEVRPDVVINAVKSSFSIDAAEVRKPEAWESNVLVPEVLSRLQPKHGYKLIHLSSDWVYEGKESETYSEKSIPYPQNFYAVTKLVAEERILRYASDYLILRTTGLFGADERKSNFFMRARKTIESGEFFDAAGDQYSQAIYGGELAQIISSAIGMKTAGTYNAVSRDYLSRYELAILFCEVYGWDARLVRRTESAKREIRVPQHLKLDISRLERDIWKVRPIKEQVQNMKQELANIAIS